MAGWLLCRGGETPWAPTPHHPAAERQIFWRDTGEQGVGLQIMRIDRPDPSPHAHEDQDQIFYLLEGSATWTLGDETHRVEAGDALYVQRQVLHGVTEIHRGPVRYVLVGIRCAVANR